MRIVRALPVVVILSGAGSGFTQDRTAVVVGADAAIPCSTRDSTLLLDASSTAQAFGWQAKLVEPGKLLTLCREQEGGVCIPVQLDRIKSATVDGRLFVEADSLARALRFAVESDAEQVRLRPHAFGAESVRVPAYHAAWGEGRGFREGQTLPDIPLYDMDGREVRFSRFLGKQYILYCWASW